ncbi:disintegrin and metalloproteinase domain-containing protein 10 [Nematostella vectensis]|nr:disintegrin and metalloproteinase domain-containing protein 10 [Nematostella vectensis]
MANSIIALLLFLTLANCEELRRLSDYIKHFEPLDYNPTHFHAIHRRSVLDGSHYELSFEAFGRERRIRLRRNTGVFTSDAVILNGDGTPLDIDMNSMVAGEVVGEPGSAVYGTMEDGKFQGKIQSNTESFYVEPSERYFDKPEFHSVIYRSEDVENKGNYADMSMKMPEILDREKRDSGEDRPRRATEQEKKLDSCTLALYADHLFTKLCGGKSRAVFKLTEHITAVQIIYKNAFNTTNYDLYSPYGITFRVKKMVIYDEQDVPDKYKDDNLAIDVMLNLLSSDDHSDVCEAFMFTDRDFDNGILGLAWIGKPNFLGGICSRYSKVGGQYISYNTGVVTLKLYRLFTPPKVSEVTFAHELGHGFGSEHDPEDGDCSPGGKDGNYIMYSKATSGDRPNNDVFSSCSLKAIRDNINDKRGDPKYSGCFISADTPICGNRIIEGNEQCDCGDENSCKAEGGCCNPPGHPQACRLTLPATCSPSQGPCCGRDCRYVGNDISCRNKTDCLDKAMCSGSSVECPKSVYQPDNTVCDKGRRVCSVGECAKSICTKYALEECQCTADNDLCTVCCKEPGKDNTCTPTRDKTQLPKQVHGLMKSAGSPCANMHGYCDAFAVCRRLDLDGPLKRLKEKFFTVKGLKELVKEKWWAILLGIIAAIVFVALLVFCCARYTPSSNPIRENKKPSKPMPGRRKKQAAPTRQLQPLSDQAEHTV